MVSSVSEAPAAPVAEAAPKTDQQGDGGRFMAMLAGLVSAQPGLNSQGQQVAETADAGSGQGTVDLAGAMTMAALTGAEPGEQAQVALNTQVAVDAAQVGQGQGSEQAKPEPVQAEQTKPAETPAQVATATVTAQEVQVQSGTAQEAAPLTADATDATEQKTPTVQAPEPRAPQVAKEQDTKPAAVETDKQGAIEALQNLTTQRAQAKALPDAARPEAEVAATLVAYRLNPMGQKSQSGEVRPQADGQSGTKESGSGDSAKNIAAASVAGSHKSEQAPVDAGTRIQIEWKPTEPVTISTSSDGAFRDAFQSANANARQSDAKEMSVANNPQQAFGVEMKSQLGTDTAVRQLQSAPAQSAPVDPTLGEKMVGQIVREVSLHKLGENTTLSIRLDPPELGTLRVSVTSQSGVLTTQLESPNAVVRGILETHLPALKDALASAGVEVSKFSVSSGSDFGANAQRQQQAWQPTRLAPAVEFGTAMHDGQPLIEAAVGGNQTSPASYSWLA